MTVFGSVYKQRTNFFTPNVQLEYYINITKYFGS